jgi:hypothetical protein
MCRGAWHKWRGINGVDLRGLDPRRGSDRRLSLRESVPLPNVLSRSESRPSAGTGPTGPVMLLVRIRRIRRQSDLLASFEFLEFVVEGSSSYSEDLAGFGLVAGDLL